MTWVPDSCTLPTAEQPFRVAEFDRLFTTGRRTDAHTLDLSLTSGSYTEAADLIARESACCSFFTFTLTDTQLRIQVRPAHTAVLDALAARFTP